MPKASGKRKNRANVKRPLAILELKATAKQSADRPRAMIRMETKLVSDTGQLSHITGRLKNGIIMLNDTHLSLFIKSI
jgi:hypothetical protein